MLKKTRLVTTLILVLCGAGTLGWASKQARKEVIVQTILPAEMSISGDNQREQEVGEPMTVSLEWPSSLRIGDTGEVRLVFQPSANIIGANDQGDNSGNVYHDYNLMAEGRFEVAGVSVEPANPVRESLPEGDSVEFNWKISASREGIYPGTVWLSIRFLPLDGTAASQKPIFVTTMDLKMTSFLGMSGFTTRLIGGLALGFGVLLCLDVMIAWIIQKISRAVRRG